MREIVLDTETTGFDPHTGDRLVEIGCVEMLNHIPTGEVHHVYINPERDMPQSAFEVHGLSEEFLSDKPLFKDVAEAFRTFVGEGTLVIHNASFDMNFLNAELKWIGYDAIPDSQVLDTLALARRKHPAGPNSLDALCSRYGIDNSRRTKHGALLDAELLAEVYIELIGGKQTALGLMPEDEQDAGDLYTGAAKVKKTARARPTPLQPRISAEEEAAHAAFIKGMGEDALWLKTK
ncbi:MAG: DNA polymerase III subunit epsilon [Stappiaceae bacterium]